MRAVFKHSSTSESDRFKHELAAYRLDRLLGLDMVPVTVARTVGNRKGILQFWVDGSMTLRQMIEQKQQPDGWCDTNPQYNLMNLFDVLIHNPDRTQENALFTKDWMLVLIDHSRAFSTEQREPPLLYTGGVQVPAALARRLKTLDAETLQSSLGPSLNRRQIDALLKRRDRLLSQGGVPAANPKVAVR